MARAFDNAVKGLHLAARASRGLVVSYSRNGSAAQITAIPGQTRVTAADESGLTIQAKRRDWIISAADLILAGEVVLPEVGDLIRLTVGQEVQVFEVQRLAGEAHYYAQDDLGQVLRIHTRQIDTEAA
jgi:hypothetical protein